MARLHDLGRAVGGERAPAARRAPGPKVELQLDGAGSHVEGAREHVPVAGHAGVSRVPARCAVVDTES